ncbi:MAG: hypothetical protein OXG68_01340 [Chloroflexi bacterium]|nr:hypothetical protein [Chloroflexota bacterium]
MRMLDNFWRALRIVGAAREMAIETRRFNWKVAAGTTFFLQAEYADIHLVSHDRPEVLAKVELQAGFGWQLAADQDEAGVYMIARRKAIIGSLGRAKFDIKLPVQTHISLKLENCQVCLADLNTALDLRPFAEPM